MSFSAPFGDMPRPRPRPAPDASSSGPRRISPLAITIGVLVALIVLLVVASEVWTKYLWMDQLEFTDVLMTRWGTQAVLFLIGTSTFRMDLAMPFADGVEKSGADEVVDAAETEDTQ